jgi:hypothetical protein
MYFIIIEVDCFVTTINGGARPKTLVGIFFSYQLETIGRNFLPT